MFLSIYVQLKPGDICRVTCPSHAFYGHIIQFKQIEYYMQTPTFVFETNEQKRVAILSDHQFETLPYKGSLECLIDIALQTSDQEWFHELVSRYKNESI